jgi:hypothetical protein
MCLSNVLAKALKRGPNRSSDTRVHDSTYPVASDRPTKTTEALLEARLRRASAFLSVGKPHGHDSTAGVRHLRVSKKHSCNSLYVLLSARVGPSVRRIESIRLARRDPPS